MSGADLLIHATSVAIDGRALLIEGRSGSGKSDLALRLIDRGALLISDDYTIVEARGDILVARSAPRIAGRIEMRGVGIVERAFIGEAPVAILLALDESPDRLPEASSVALAGIAVPRLAFAAFEASAAIKAEAALRLHGLSPRSEGA